MTAEERRRVAAESSAAEAKAAAAAASAALKAELETQKTRDAELSAGREPHRFFAMHKEKTAAAKSAVAQNNSPAFVGGFFEPKPAPIEKAGPPAHVGRPGERDDERRAREALSSFLGPRRAAMDASVPLVATNLVARRFAEVHANVSSPNDFSAKTMTMTKTSGAEEPSAGLSREELEDATLTDAAKFVLAGEGRWNAAAIVSGALAETRGELRRRLGEIRARGPASRDGASLLWVDAYKPAATSDVVGDVAAAAQVRDWLGAWRAHIAAEAFGSARETDGDKPKKRGPGPGRPKKKPRRHRESSDEDALFDPEVSDDERDEKDGGGFGRYVPLVDARGVPATGALLCGPSGACKTACAYAAAREMGFTVLEVNPSRKRSGAEILAQFAEATQSRRLAEGAGTGGGGGAKASAAGFFGALKRQKRAAPDDGGGESASASVGVCSATNAAQNNTNTLILFEEVDVLRGEDRGFMAALAALIRDSKRPIALTSNATSLPGLAGSGAETVAGVGADGLPLARVRFKAPSAAEAAAYASLVASVEGVSVPPAAVAAAAAPDESGNDSGKRAGGDVRRALHAAHFLSFGVSDAGADRLGASSFSRASGASGPRLGATLTLGDVLARLVAETEDSELARLEASAPASARRAAAKASRALAKREARALSAVEAGAMRRALAALAAAEAAKKARRAKNAEEKRALLSLGVAPKPLLNPPKGSLGLEPVPDADAEAAATAARVEKTRAEAAAMGIRLVAEAGSESDATVEADGLAGEAPETTREAEACAAEAEGAEKNEAVEKTRAEGDDSEDEDSDADDDADVDDERAEDSLRPADGWRRALDEMARLAFFADAFSAADAMRRPAAVGASGPAVAPFGHAGFAAEDGDDDGAFDGTRAENRGGVDLIGEPRRTLGGGGDVARDAASLLNRRAFSLAPRGVGFFSDAANEADEEATKTKTSRSLSKEAHHGLSKPTNVALLATATDPRATASRLKELAECTGAAVLRGARGGGGFGGAGEAAERVAFLARMATLQAANREAAKARRRRPVKHLLASAETVAELETVGRFGA